MPAITLPDGSIRQFDGAVTGTTIAAAIGPGGTGTGRGRGVEEGEGESRAEENRGRARVPFRLVPGAIVHFSTAGMTNPRNESLREPLRNDCLGREARKRA